ncbi:MAG: SRPBCC family protein [Solirubrobacterales bacterium]
MILTNEFTVGSDVETVWRHLLDMERVAECLPGATIEGTGEENTFNGSMRVRIGPMTVDYAGTAVLEDVDEEARTAAIALSASEAKGQGTAMATIRNRLEATDAGTRVISETDLEITGPQAQFGQGVMEDVGGRVLDEFAQRLEAQISAGDAGVEETPQPTGEVEDDALDLGSIAADSVRERYGRTLLAAAAGLLALIVLRGILRR